jgi:hypothetical protein
MLAGYARLLLFVLAGRYLQVLDLRLEGSEKRNSPAVCHILSLGAAQSSRSEIHLVPGTWSTPDDCSLRSLQASYLECIRSDDCIRTTVVSYFILDHRSRDTVAGDKV